MEKHDSNRLEAKLTKICEEAQLTGMALILSKHGRPIFQKYYGWRDVDNQHPVTSDTIFGAASITKSLTAMAIMHLEDAGKLTAKDPVKQWIPEFSLPDHTYESDILIHHLLTHTSGLPGLPAVHAARLPSIMQDPDGSYLFDEMPENIDPISTVSQLIDLLPELDFQMLGAPGEVFNYSNEGFALLQEIIERASGERFTDYVKRYIFSPLDMKRSMFTTADLQRFEDVTELYAYEKARPAVFHSPAWWDVGGIHTNGSLKISVADLMTYLEIFRRDGRVNGVRMLSENSLRKMTTPHVTTPNGTRYGYGLQIDALGEVQLIGHGGSIKGVSSNMQWAKETGITGAVLINIAGADAAGILKTAMGFVLGEYDEEGSVSTINLTSDQQKKYVGHYRSDEGQSVRVSLVEGVLQLIDNKSQTPLKPIGNHQFLTGNNKTITFLPDQNQHITAIFTGMRQLQKTKD
ncbi:Beta-lactamase [Lentibacillus sp. JNUCC-1]|uniref:serine hydrolase domain-containing protein n=1 Tax=Lentibacillus sp. JNUCC-1 TaxID=2654513 RepID=UPI0012E77125|nr:serine hydrolase domain-containing protein [Lentibacillus sp. JNUCC-1]MUV36872.1 Beta-lactamase [Lentibacillus sp. JNUCC-1]